MSIVGAQAEAIFGAHTFQREIGRGQSVDIGLQPRLRRGQQGPGGGGGAYRLTVGGVRCRADRYQAGERAAEARATADLIQVLGHELLNGISPIVSLAESGVAAVE